MGIVIFFVGSRAGELNALVLGSLVAEIKEVGVDEFTAVVGIDAAQPEGQSLLDLSKRLDDPMLSLTPDRLAFDPAGCDIDAVQSVEKLPGRRSSRMRDQIDLQVARQSHIPMLGFTGIMCLRREPGRVVP